MKRRAAAAVLVFVLALTAGCGPALPGGPEPAGSRTSSGSVASSTPVYTPAETLPPSAAIALPLQDGAPVRDPSAGASDIKQVLKPGVSLVLTRPALGLLRKSVEGTMVAQVVGVDVIRREIVVRVVVFSIPYLVGAMERPAALSLPKGTLVRIRLPEPRRGEALVPLDAIGPRRVAALYVRVGLEPAGEVFRLLGVNGERGAR